MDSERVLYLYEVEHGALARDYMARWPRTKLVVADFRLGQLLTTQGLSVEYVSPLENPAPLLRWCESAARTWYQHPASAFFRYKNVTLGEAYEPMFDFYLQRLVYASQCIERIYTAYPGARLVIPHTHLRPSALGGALAPLEIQVMADAAAAVATANGTAVEFLGTAPVIPKRHIYPYSALRNFLYGIFNACISLAPERPIRIFVSEQWKNIHSFAAHLPNAEFVFLERRELLKVPRVLLWRHRIRFMHTSGEFTPTVRAAASKTQSGYRLKWKEGRALVLRDCFPGPLGGTLQAPIGRALDYLVETYAERLVAEYDALERLFVRERINRVLLRAGIGGRQTHYFLATRVAESLEVPSFELQHALEIADGRSVHSRLAARYLAAYGEGVRSLLVRLHNYNPERIVPIGSPRFDTYISRASVMSGQKSVMRARLGLAPERPVVFVGMPAEVPDLYPVHFTSSEVGDFIVQLHHLQRSFPNLQFVLKFRPHNVTEWHRKFVQSVFSNGGVYVAEFEDPFDLLCSADIACVGNSTLLYEALLARVPVLLHPVRAHDDSFIKEFGEAGTLVSGTEELESAVASALDPKGRDALVQKGSAFLKSRCRFDGKSGQRMADLLAHPKLLK